MYRGAKSSSTLTPSCDFGRSRTWPTEARTSYSRPRMPESVRAFAGDSTITRLLPLALRVVGALAPCCLRGAFFLAAGFFLAPAFLAARLLRLGRRGSLYLYRCDCERDRRSCAAWGFDAHFVCHMLLSSPAYAGPECYTRRGRRHNSFFGCGYVTPEYGRSRVQNRRSPSIVSGSLLFERSRPCQGQAHEPAAKQPCWACA